MNKIIIVMIILITSLNARTLRVGLSGDYDYTTIAQASKFASGGDTILVLSGEYPGGEYISDLKGEPDKWIRIIAELNGNVIFKGGSEAWHFTDVEYIYISGFVFESQTANGVNIDDGGSYESPTHNIIIENCTWRSIAASGNNDELKLSGVDNFIVRNCKFFNGAARGSLVDMVGCHDGLFEGNHFENAGSNSIQAKGGTKNIRIERNLFINGGGRALNIGGSTGLQYFRPMGINYESSDIIVFANVFFGSEAPIAFVGTINSRVYNNTLIQPDKWAIRILQENVEGFLSCGNNSFINNIVYLGNNAANPTLNIGGNTSPETFTFSNNLWYNYENRNWSGPNLPVNDNNGIIGENPELTGIVDRKIGITSTSPAIGKGLSLYEIREHNLPNLDFSGNMFAEQPTIGAIEGNINTGIYENKAHRIGNNFNSDLIIIDAPVTDEYEILIYDIGGKKIIGTGKIVLQEGSNTILIKELLEKNNLQSAGIYFLTLRNSNKLLFFILNLNNQ